MNGPVSSRRIDCHDPSAAPRSSASTISSVATAPMTPIGSIRIASDASTERSRGARRTARRIGWITVGPVTTTSDPSTIARGHESPMIQCAATAVPRAVTMAPTVRRPSTARGARISSLRSR
jgi:hypothetical protein